MRCDSPLILIVRLVLSVLGWIYIWVVALLIFPLVCLLWLVTLPFDRNGVALHMLSGVWSTLYLRAHPGWRLRIEGRKKLPWKGAAILVANHQSQVDPLVAFTLFRPFKPVTKSNVRWLPVFGCSVMMNRYVTLSRGERRSVARMAEDCRYWIRRGVPVMIYPEGTRSPDGEIREFKNGAFTLAVEENCPVFPVVIDGGRDALPKNSALIGLRANLRARVLDPVYPNSPEIGSPQAHARERAAALRDRVRQLMIRELAAMRAERRA